MNFTKYDNYKDSGLDWLGEIPAGWDLARIKEIGIVNARVGWKALKASEYVEKSDYFFLATPNIKYNEIDFVNVNYLTKERYDESPEIMLEIDDILLAKDGSTLGTVNIVKYLPSKGTVNSSIAVLRFNKYYFNKYVLYQIKSAYLQNIINLKKDGAGVPHLFQKDINNFSIISPKFEDQIKIANFLDEKTAKIDKKIELLQAKKLKYQELRKTLINEAVTKGLDKNVELKESSVEWIGKIPKHWEVKRIKDFTYVKGRIGWQGLRSDEFLDETDYFCVTGTDFRGGEIDWKNCYCVEEFRYQQDKFIQLKLGDLLITKDGSIGKLALIKHLPKKTTLNSGVFVTRPLKNKYTNSFMFWLLFSGVFKNFIDYSKNGSTILHLYQNVFERFSYGLPPILEQISIANYLDEKTSKIDAIITAIDKNISTLNEFRKTLINDAVTGKIKVV